jgi:hypothetical protein
MNEIASTHVINCDSDPFIPDKRWKVVSHRLHGLLEWGSAQMPIFHLSANEKCGIEWSSEHISLIKIFAREKVEKGQRGAEDWMVGRHYVNLEKLRIIIESVTVLNANVLDYLIEYPELIPEEWKTIKGVIFYGTIYKFGSNECVRFLRWRAGRWDWDFIDIDGWWGFHFDRGSRRYYPAAILRQINLK